MSDLPPSDPPSPGASDQAPISQTPEQILCNAVSAGKRAQLNGATLDAKLIRALALDIHETCTTEPSGIQIDNAVINGPLNLEGCSVEIPLLFFNCRFGEAGEKSPRLQLRDARFKRLGFYHCVINGRFNADRIVVEGSAFIQGTVINGRLRLRGAELKGSLSLEQSEISEEETALVLDNARIDGPLLLRGSRLKGELRFPSAFIKGGFLAEALYIKHAETAIIADGAQIDGPWVMSRAHIYGGIQMRAVEAKGMLLSDAILEGKDAAIYAESMVLNGDMVLPRALIKGGVLLTNCRIQGRFMADHAKFKAPNYAITAGGLYVRQGLSMSSAEIEGAVLMDGAEIGKAFFANKMVLNSKHRALSASVIEVGGDWIMRGAKITGSVRIPGAKITGQLALTEAEITSKMLAIRADGCTIKGGWFMGRAKITGRVRLPSSTIGNQLRFRGSKFHVYAGPAIVLNGSTIERDLMFNEGFVAEGGIALDQTKINGMADFRGSKITSALLIREGKENDAHWDQDELVPLYDHTALSFLDAKISRLHMPEKAEFRPKGIVDLARAHIGAYEDYAEAWPPAFAQNGALSSARSQDLAGREVDHLILDGLSYDHLENPSGYSASSDSKKPAYTSRASDKRVQWLAAQAHGDLFEHFKPQAWVHLARRLNAQGFHEEARQISIARKRWHRRSTSVRPRSQFQSYLLDIFALFGFNPWRTIYWMAGFIILFSVIWFSALQNCTSSGCQDESVFVRTEHGRFSAQPKEFARTYPDFHPLAYSFDLFIPVISFGYQDYWRPNLNYGPIGSTTLINPLAYLSSSPGSNKPSKTITIRYTWGGILYVLYITEMILGLVLTSLAVTGFTGMLRQEE